MYREQLIKAIVKERFGNKPEQVVSLLLDKGRMTVSQVAKETKSSFYDTRNILLALIQQGILNYTTQYKAPDLIDPNPDAPPEDESPIYYLVNEENSLMIPKFSFFIHRARTDFGDEAAQLLKELLENGRLTTKDVVSKVLENIGEYDEQDPLGGSSTETSLKDTFNTMIRHRYVVRVTPGPRKDSASQLQVSNYNSKTKGRKRKILSDDLSSTKKRKRSTTEKTTNVEEAESASQDTPSAKRQRLSNIEDITVLDDDTENVDNVLWRVNYDEFVRLFRHNAIVDYVDKKINTPYAEVMRAILKLTGPYEQTINDEQSSIITHERIFRYLHEIGNNKSEETLNNYLEAMVQNGILSKIGFSNGGSYAVNLSKISNIVKQKYAESIVFDRFGREGCRIFRMLLHTKQMEQKKIAEMALMDTNKAKELLYRMFGGHMVKLQEVPRGSDHNPMRTFFFWNVDLASVYRKIKEDMYKTCLNLMLRLDAERKTAWEAIGQQMSRDLTPEEMAYQERLERAENRLDNSLIRVHNLLLYFEYF